MNFQWWRWIKWYKVHLNSQVLHQLRDKKPRLTNLLDIILVFISFFLFPFCFLRRFFPDFFFISFTHRAYRDIEKAFAACWLLVNRTPYTKLSSVSFIDKTLKWKNVQNGARCASSNNFRLRFYKHQFFFHHTSVCLCLLITWKKFNTREFQSN